MCIRDRNYAMTHKYKRGKIPSPGFTAGPCLFKDTMQLSAFSNNNFSLGMEAMSTNEGLVNYIVGKLIKKYTELGWDFNLKGTDLI